jgi:predicted dehydrogenase
LKFLIIGCGSIGQRHIQNLNKLGYKKLSVFDTNKELLKKVKRKFSVDIITSLKWEKVDCTLICTPPNSHIKLAKLALENKSHVFIEKPLSNSQKGVSELKKIAKSNKLLVFVGYTFRFDSGLQLIKKILEQKKIGKIISFDAYEGWYLPNWRPWQDYRKSYTSSEKLGGGIILDGSHELNYLLWLGGNVKEVFSYYSAIPSLKVKTEGIAEILLKFKSCSIGRIHLDFINPKYNRHCEILGEKGSIRWNFELKKIEIQKIGSKKYRTIKYGKNNNEMYMSEIKHIISCISGKKNTIIGLNEAEKTLNISNAIKKSGRTRRVVSV